MKISRQSIKKGTVLAIILTLWLRIVTGIVGYHLVNRLNAPVTTREMDYSQNIPTDRSDPWFFLVQPLHRFDALWYDQIAKTNYRGDPATAAFFPLYVWVIQGGSFLLNLSYSATAYIINTILTFLVFFLLYYLTRLDHSEKVAKRTLCIFAFFPTSFFLLAPYADGLLMVSTLAAFLFARTGKVLLTILAVSLATMTKPYGIVLIIPLMLILLQKKRMSEKITIIFLLLLIPLSFIAISKYQDSMTGVSNAFMYAQTAWKKQFPNPIVVVLTELAFFLRAPLDLPNNLNVLTVIATLVYLFKTWKKKINASWIHAAVFFVVFYVSSFKGLFPFFSFSRYALIFFPVFQYFGQMKLKPNLEVIYLTSSTVLLVFFYIYYVLGFFVA